MEAAGKEFTIPTPLGKRTVKIKKVSVKGVGDKLVVGLDLTGAIDGTAWIVGQLDYKPADRILRIGLIEADLDTKNCC
ncbi:MAG: DUF4403 family protein [Chromatiaceae bacterium]|nr:DUF4403 family protein [Zoogloeaceae bacterium]MCP5426637.1 DUF4403 family protein [Chromatiaceae bacterium]